MALTLVELKIGGFFCFKDSLNNLEEIKYISVFRKIRINIGNYGILNEKEGTAYIIGNNELKKEIIQIGL